MPVKRSHLSGILFIFCISLAGCLRDQTPLIQSADFQPTSLPPTATEEAVFIPTATLTPTEIRPTSTTIPTPSSIPTDQIPGFGYGPSDFPEHINPLTGLVSDVRLLNRRPMAIKITNFPRSVRPQWGLNSADHVYEYYLEDELTRFIGIFYGQNANQVGPVRSARPFDAQVVAMYNSIFAFGYADKRVMDYLMDSYLRNLLVIQRPDNCPPMCRIEAADKYNNLYTDTELLSYYVTDRGTSNHRQNLDGLRFEATSLITSGGGQGERLAVQYSNESFHYWEFDPFSQRYLRWQESDSTYSGGESYQPLIDSLTGAQVAADNLVVLLVHTDYFYKSNSTEIFDIMLQGRGEAYALREGRIFQVYWERPALDALLSLKFPNGSNFPLKPGNVWFLVLGKTSPHKILDDHTWHFTFNIP